MYFETEKALDIDFGTFMKIKINVFCKIGGNQVGNIFKRKIVNI